LPSYQVPAPTAQRSEPRRRRRARTSPAAKTALAATIVVVVVAVVAAVAICAWRRRRRRRQETYDSVEQATKGLELSDLAVEESGAWIMDETVNPMV
jgi:cytoskeletal protein RodZ